MLQLQFVNFRKGSYLIVEGKADADRFMIIQTGQVSCRRSDEAAGAVTDRLLGPGDFVGVISCMSGHSQVENAIAVTDVVCISVRRDQYPELIARNTPVAMKIIRTFANRMRVLNETLMKLSADHIVRAEAGARQIFNVASLYDKLGKTDIAIYAYYQYLKTRPVGPEAEIAKRRFVQLKPTSKAVYFESNSDLLRVYPKDTMIMAEAQNGADMFIIQEGQVKISKVIDGKEVTLALLKKGDMFGEMALLENKPRSASAIANENCRLMTVNRQNFDQMVATQAQLIARLTTMLAERLWSMYRQLFNTSLSDPIAKMIDMLALQVEKSKMRVDEKTHFQTDLTTKDLATMCGLSQEQQNLYLYQITQDPLVKINPENNKIFIPNCLELIKQAAFYRKQRH